MMDFLHYSAAPIVLERRAYEQKLDFKPQGLWLSVGDDWKRRCESEEWGTDRLLVAHHVELVDAANILRLATAEEIDRFTQEFGMPMSKGLRAGYIDWPRVASQWQGVIITPYCWSRRLSMHTMWYYGWDCASGCIWDLAVIRAVRGEVPSPSLVS